MQNNVFHISVQAFILALLSTAVFPPKIQFFHCLLSSKLGKIFEIYVSIFQENAFLTLFLTAES